MVLDPRVEDTVQRYYPRLRSLPDEKAAPAFFWFLSAVDLAIGLTAFLALCLLLVLPALGELLGAAFNEAFAITAVATASALAASGTLNAAFAVSNSLEKLAKARLAMATMTFGVSLGALLLWGPQAYLLALFSCALISIVVITVLAMKQIPFCWRKPRTMLSSMPTGWLRFTGFSSLGTSLASGGDSASLALAGIAGGDLTVVLLKIAQAPGRFVLSVFSPISTQVFPRASTKASSGDMQGLVDLCWKATKSTVAPVTALILLSLFALPWLIPVVYGTTYATATTASLLFVVGAGVRVLISWSKVLPLAIGRPELRLLVLSFEAIVTLSSVFVLASTLTSTAAVTALGLVSIATGVALASFWFRFISRVKRSRARP
jgi:O-antigen/teichoic acid export membrane protein